MNAAENALREILGDQGCPSMPCPHWIYWHTVAHRALAPIEVWRPVVGYENHYEVSNLGNVRSLSKRRSLAGSIDSCGYRRVTLWTPSGQATKKVARLVCEAFNGAPSALHREVAHLDNDRQNNRADNLKWVSHAENISHKRAYGTDGVGERHPRATLTNAQAAEIKAAIANGASNRRLAELYGVTTHVIQDIRRGKNWQRLDGEATKAGNSSKPNHIGETNDR